MNMKISRRHVLAAALAPAIPYALPALSTLSTLAPLRAAHAADADYPARAITLVVPHPPGGPVDSVARFFAEQLRAELKQTVVVENRAGASSMIGAEQVARAPADGYLLYINASLHVINSLLYRDTIKYDAVRDFTPLGLLAQGPLVFLVNPSVKATTAKGFADLVRSAPERYSFATGGFGAADHLASAWFLHEIGLKNVPIVLYKGGAPALQDLVGGSVAAKMDAILTALPLVNAGKVRALAVTGAARSPQLPDVPTMREAGFGDFEFSSWYGFWGPPGLPEPIARKLTAATRNIMASPAMSGRLEKLGFSVDFRPPAEFSAFIDSELRRYRQIIADGEIKAN